MIGMNGGGSITESTRRCRFDGAELESLWRIFRASAPEASGGPLADENSSRPLFSPLTSVIRSAFGYMSAIQTN
jgi:hypothetical protein